MKPREYCCCAIPLLYAGIFTVLLEQLVLGVVAGTLSIATPSIVGASTPSFAKWIFAVACWVGAAIQILGFMAVRQERPVFFSRYVTLHALASVAIFGIAAAWIIMSATRHTQAQAQCIADFFVNTVSATNSEGQTLCDIFPWVDVGIMGGLWLFFLCVQLYFYIVLLGYRKGQKSDHDQYPLLEKTDNIPLAAPRNSSDSMYGDHARNTSNASNASLGMRSQARIGDPSSGSRPYPERRRARSGMSRDSRVPY